MKPKSSAILLWTPRILAILFILFLSSFALDVFDQGRSIWETVVGLTMHLLPSIALSLALVLAWRRPWTGALGFILFRSHTTIGLITGLCDIAYDTTVFTTEDLGNCSDTAPAHLVCIGEQMLFERSEEGDTAGLGLFPGEVVRFRDAAMRTAEGVRLKVPHMGWNRVRQVQPHPLWNGVADESWFYFVHSYYVVPQNDALSAGISDYGGTFTCAVARDNIFATQFHPEKSAAAGLRIYENFSRWAP